ncbi:hypothetical protein K501DRAFT_166451 [Backusella circina FSU 941]|nr:hypothetical protein K501DRAFT_166451 [Backusella circina FSU 941]
MQSSSSLKRGRPRHDVIEQNTITKKRKYQLSTSYKPLDKSTAFDCLQACQSIATENTNSKLSVLSDTPRATKGLRHFSKQVCDKVAEKGVTTYNEVADELALDIKNSENENGEKHVYDQKNIRRRVYDALNVLMAMNIITKDKKVIKWLGIPKCYQQTETNNETDLTRKSLLQQIEEEENKQNELVTSLNKLRSTVNDKLVKHLQIRNLVRRNQKIETPSSKKISLPFLIITCPPNGKDFHVDIGQDR